MSNDRFRFRVWNIKDKEYLDPEYYEEFALTPDGEIHVGLTVWNGIGDEFQVIPPKQLIVEQCIGLKDKNGELIYAGDLLGTSKDDDEFIEICWCNTLASYMCDIYPETYGNLETCDVEYLATLEIIGNIHEYKRKENE